MTEQDQSRGVQAEQSPDRDGQGRFLPGTSGNPHGRPRKAAKGKLDLMGVLTAPVQVRQADGRVQKIPHIVAHIKILQSLVLKGDKGASRQLIGLFKEVGGFEKAKEAHNHLEDEKKAQARMLARVDEFIRRKKERDSS